MRWAQDSSLGLQLSLLEGQSPLSRDSPTHAASASASTHGTATAVAATTAGAPTAASAPAQGTDASRVSDASARLTVSALGPSAEDNGADDMTAFDIMSALDGTGLLASLDADLRGLSEPVRPPPSPQAPRVSAHGQPGAEPDAGAHVAGTSSGDHVASESLDESFNRYVEAAAGARWVVGNAAPPRCAHLTPLGGCVLYCGAQHVAGVCTALERRAVRFPSLAWRGHHPLARPQATGAGHQCRPAAGIDGSARASGGGRLCGRHRGCGGGCGG